MPLSDMPLLVVELFMLAVALRLSTKTIEESRL